MDDCDFIAAEIEADALKRAREAKDADRLRYMMEEGQDGFVHVTKDRYDYAYDVARERRHCEPTTEDELEGFRRMIDCAMAGGDRDATTHVV